MARLGPRRGAIRGSVLLLILLVTGCAGDDGKTATASGSLDEPRYASCGGHQVGTMHVDTNKPNPNGNDGWTMVADVWVRNHRGPDCSFRAYPHVVFREVDRPTGRDVTKGPTTQTRSETLAEEWVDLPWYPSGSQNVQELGHFLVYTTQFDTAGEPCPPERIFPADELDITIGELGTFHVNGMPMEGGPQVASCEGRIAVTPFAQLNV